MANNDKNINKVTQHKWAYQLNDGSFYKKGDRGSWSTSNKPYSKKELTTCNLSNATFFNICLDSPPYCARFMIGGNWIKVTIIKTYSLDQL